MMMVVLYKFPSRSNTMKTTSKHSILKSLKTKLSNMLLTRHTSLRKGQRLKKYQSEQSSPKESIYYYTGNIQSRPQGTKHH